MFCRFCGRNILDDSTFCSYCGKSIGEIQTKDANMNDEKSIHIDEYYKRKAAKTAGNGLITAAKIACYLALAVFLIFNVKMAPLYGWRHYLLYAVSALIATGLVGLFCKKVCSKKNKFPYLITLIVSIFIIVSSISLRIIYEAKVDSAIIQFPSDGEILIRLTEKTEYYNATGSGFITNPGTNIRIGNHWCEDGAIVPVVLNRSYQLRVGAGGYEGTGYIDDSITFTKSSFSQGKLKVIKDINITLETLAAITSEPSAIAEVEITFERYCTFWEVIFD